jgi:hypothetical protein
MPKEREKASREPGSFWFDWLFGGDEQWCAIA